LPYQLCVTSNQTYMYTFWCHIFLVTTYTCTVDLKFSITTKIKYYLKVFICWRWYMVAFTALLLNNLRVNFSPFYCFAGYFSADNEATRYGVGCFKRFKPIPYRVRLAMLSVYRYSYNALNRAWWLYVVVGHCSSLSPCHQICIDLIGGGFECGCKSGFQLQSNGFACLRE